MTHYLILSVPGPKRHIISLLALLCVWLAIIPSKTLTAQQISGNLLIDIDSIISRQRDVAEIPGIAVAVIDNNKVIYKKALGWQDLESKTPLNTRSDFHMASVSKPFAALAIMQLVENGKAVLDSPLVRYLPSFKMKDSAYARITLRNMLTHSSGIPDVSDYEWDKPQTDDSAIIRYIETFAAQSLNFPPGTSFSYSNAAYNLLAAVVTRLSGMTFESYMKKYVFTPAGMKNSTFLKPVAPSGGAAAPHVLDKDLAISRSNIYPYNRIHAASSTLHSNIEDMVRWALIWLNNGSLDGRQVVSAKSVKSMTTAQMPVQPGYSICLGWFMTHIGDVPVFFHPGGDLGYRTYIGFVPSRRLAVILMGNNSLFDSRAVATNILDRIILNKPVQLAKIPINQLLKKYIISDGIGKVKEVYFDAKKSHQDAYDFSSAHLDRLGYMLLKAGHTQNALDIFLFNVELDPGFAGWYDSVGDGYKALDKKELAIEWYRKALKIDPSLKQTEKKIAELQ